MRGMPLMRALLVFCALVLFGWPLRVITREQGALRGDGGEGAVAAESGVGRGVEGPGDGGRTAVRLPLQVSFARVAEYVGISHLGKTVWEKERPGLREGMELDVAFPKEGIELGVVVRWSGEELSAVRLQLTLPEGGELERSVWGAGNVETVVPFP